MNINHDLCPSCFAIIGGLAQCPYCGYDRNALRPASAALPLKTVLNGQYLIGRVLGQGGFGITYLGFDLNLKCKIAIKEFFPSGQVMRNYLNVLPAAPENESTFRKGVDSFYQEASILARFRTIPEIVSVYSFFRENNTAYFIMEYLEGKSLKDYVLVRGGHIPWQEAIALLQPIMKALEIVHQQGLLHRDVSPDNIFLMNNGVEKLLDFGAARFTFSEKTQSSMSIIKPGYAPIEQYSKISKQGTWTDVYALGGTLYRISTGKLPTEAPDRVTGTKLPEPITLQPDIPPFLNAAIMKAMSMEQTERFQSVAEFRMALCPPLPVTQGLQQQRKGEMPYSQVFTAAPVTAQRWSVAQSLPDSAYLSLNYSDDGETDDQDQSNFNGTAYLIAVVLMALLIILILYVDRNALWCDWFRFLWSTDACAAYG